MIDLDDAFRTVVGYMEQKIVGIGYELPDNYPDPKPKTDLGLPIFSKDFFHMGELAGRVMPAPPDPKWIKEHVPGLAFWPIGFAATVDYPIKKKWIEKNKETREVLTKFEYYRARILIQAEMLARSNMERTLFLAQMSHLLNTKSFGTGRIKTLKGDYIYLKLIESREPQEPEQTVQGIYRLVMTWQLAVRDYIDRTDPMFMSARYTIKYNGEKISLPFQEAGS
jgi:hypothetical protein